MCSRRIFYSILFSAAILVLLSFRKQMRNGLIQRIPLEENYDRFDQWAEPPFPLDFKVYIFQVKNPDEVVFNGAIPEVQEAGPYVYKHFLRKEKIGYEIDNDLLTYQQYHYFDFDVAASAPLSDDDVITVLNLPLQIILQEMENMDVENLTAAVLDWNSAFNNTSPHSLFHNVTVKDYLFEGYRFCVPDDIEKPTLNMFCNNARNITDTSKFLLLEEDTSMIFSFFMHKNYNNDGEYQIKAGTVNIYELGEIERWDDQEYLTNWMGDHSMCNTIRGRSSYLFPPILAENIHFEIYDTDICRVVHMIHTRKTRFKGLSGEVFALGSNTFSNNKTSEEFGCYCIQQIKNLEGEFECLPSGFGDMRTCLGASIVTSNPHLLWADKLYQETVIGLLPDESLHSTYVKVEPKTGTVLQGIRRLQYNLFIRPIDNIDITKNITPAVLPLLWFEDITELSNEVVNDLKKSFLENEK